jgi:hypothetical protein
MRPWSAGIVTIYRTVTAFNLRQRGCNFPDSRDVIKEDMNKLTARIVVSLRLFQAVLMNNLGGYHGHR